MPDGFAHLHVHSHYSLLEAIPKLDALIEAAKADGQQALALTDLGSMYGSIEFYKECTKAGIKPIIGVDFFVAARTRRDMEMKTDERHSRLVLLAKDEAGYHNLIRLVSLSYIEGFFDRPRIDRELIATYATGLVAILPAIEGEHVHAIADGSPERAKETLAWYRKTFADDCYTEITHHPEIDGHEERIAQIRTLATEAHVPLVAAHETYYLEKGDAIAREMTHGVEG
jgi:DNA polymerase-3 subunit alpha